jgi:glycosyltransferase involved in cell wall biosynthesis
MQSLSAVIITRNEARNIGPCLLALQGVCDEVVVVDAESTDATRAIAEGHGARVTIRTWTDYSDQKNFANGLASHDLVLSLDADEVLSPELRASLLAVKRDGAQGAYSMHRLTNYCGSWVRHGGWYPDTKVRLFDRRQARWEGAHVHETLALAPGTPITLLKGDLLHYSYHTIADHEARIERYSDLHARKMLAEGREAGVVKLWLSPAAKFLQGYLLQGGFLDGRAGYDIARLSARAVHLKYAKLNALRRAQQA